MAGIAVSRKSFVCGFEILSVKLFGQAIGAFQKRLAEGDHLIYLSCAGVHSGDIAKVELASTEDQYGEECLELEVWTKNPGGHIADFVRDHWEHRLGMSIKDKLYVTCADCNTLTSIDKEAFDD